MVVFVWFGVTVGRVEKAIRDRGRKKTEKQGKAKQTMW